MDKQKVYWSLFDNGTWRFPVAATERGLCYAGIRGEGKEAVEKWAEKHFPGSTLEQNAEYLERYERELAEFFAGERSCFTLPVDLRGTPFQMSVWGALAEIPYGHTVSYSDIAAAIGKPRAIRAAASAVGANPVLAVIPCHRVIGKNGELTGFRGGMDMKQALLALEEGHSASSAQ